MSTLNSKTPLLLGGLLLLSVIIGFFGWFIFLRSDSVTSGPKTPGADPAVSIVVQDSTGTLANNEATPIVSDREIVLSVDPGSYSQMRISTDVTFSDAQWQPSDQEMVLESRHSGFQQIFAQFSNDDQVETTAQTSVYISNDSDEEGSAIKSVSQLGPNSILIHIEDGELLWSNGSSMVSGVTGLNDSLLENWSLTTDTNAVIETIEVNSSGLASGLSDDENLTLSQFDVVVYLSANIVEGSSYELISSEVGSATLVADWKTDTSRLVQVNQVGWEPNDQKTAYVGGWNGEKNPLGDTPPSSLVVIDAGTNEAVLSATASGTQSGDGILSQAVTAFDITELIEPGTYKACVENVGCSYEFDIADDIWQDVAGRIARSAYHQRSGTSLGLPYTTIERPRQRHPEEGNSVLQTNLSLLDGETIYADQLFEKIQEVGTDLDQSETAWGGHHDAGDWDRRIQHIWYARAAGDLVREYPEQLGKLNMSIPESADAIPDLLDEGLWTLDLYRRMQDSNGAISGGIEATDHPRKGDTSWTSELQLYRFTPDAWSTYIYAGAAAEYAVLLQSYNPDLAAEFAASAESAMLWAEDQPLPANEDAAADVKGQRSVAAAAMFELTEDEQWLQIFLEETKFDEAPIDMLNCQSHELCDAAWIYLRLPEQTTDSAARANIVTSFERTAQAVVDESNNQPYGWTKENPFVPNVWGLGAGGAPKAVSLLRAYKLTGSPEFLNTAIESASFSLGANPIGISYITGVGKANVENPFVVDSLSGGLAVWPGTPVYGNHAISESEDWIYEFRLKPAGVEDSPLEDPYLWQFQDVHFPQWTEFTIHQSHAVALYVYGTLAAID